MIRTLTLNPAVDKTVTVEGFAVGRVNRITSVRRDAGGKGLNVARVLGVLGAPVLAVAPVAGESGRFLAGRLAVEGIPFDGLEVAGETRTNVKVVDPVGGTHTDINEPGPVLSPDSVNALGTRLLEALGPGDWAVFSGSVPAGVPQTVYAPWIAQARSRGIRTALDAQGEALDKGLAGRPDLVKPNQEELEAWAGHAVENENALFDAVSALRRAGAGTVAVTLGAKGAWLFHEQEAWFAPGLEVAVRSTVGAGDAFLAGLVWGFSLGLPAPEVLSLATAAATAGLVQPGTSAGTLEEIETYRTLVTPQGRPTRV